MKRIISETKAWFVAAITLMVTTTLQVHAQKLDWQIDSYGFFDNTEGDNSYRKDMTHFGFWVAPQLSVTSKNERHSVNASYAALTEPGTKDIVSKGKPFLYYKYDYKDLRFIFGSFPRRMMKEQMSDYIICDSVRYYKPEIGGFDFLYTNGNGHLEMFIDWIGLQQEDVREQFMVGLNTRFRHGILQWGAEGYLYHYALRKVFDENEFIHDYITAHAYAGIEKEQVGILDKLDIRAGVLMAADRDRGDINRKWHLPVGFVADVYAQWKRLSLLQTFYAGKRQQHFGNEAFGKYYLGETFTQSPWYSHTDINYEIMKDEQLSVKAGMKFNLTDGGLSFRQCLTLSYTIGGRLCSDK